MHVILTPGKPIIHINPIYYNFIGPSMGLDGKTLAEAIEIGVAKKNKWIDLLKKSDGRRD